MRNFTPSRLTSMTSICVIALVSGCTTSMPAPVQDRTSRSAAGPLSQQLLPPVPVVVSPASPALPGSTAGSQFYVVQRGETLYGIARANTTDINALAAWNNIIIGPATARGSGFAVAAAVGHRCRDARYAVLGRAKRDADADSHNRGDSGTAASSGADGCDYIGDTNRHASSACYVG